MKRMRAILFISAVLFVLFSCRDPYHLEPRFPDDRGSTGRGVAAPEGLGASQGEKRTITLTWNDDPKAALYYIYSADSPLNTFVRCGETSSTRFTLNVPPGSTVYYRVSSVAHDGTESAQSFFVRGTSLAQPFISDITDITESSASVTWYMENVFEDSYKNNLLYIVYCFNGAAEVAKIGLNGGIISENRAVFTDLAPNTRYEYQVEAYLRTDQSASEKSDRMDAATARRFRPGAPVKFRASCGTDKDKITLFFELPDIVDIALGDNKYDPKPLYFVIKKRFYSESGNNEYQDACLYFGSLTSAKPGAVQFKGEYIPGATVEWDDINIRRGVKYEYMVQSYVDVENKTITSDASKASTVGWALGEGTLSFGKVDYTKETGIDQYVSAELHFNFEFDPQEVPYSYLLNETIASIGDVNTNNPDAIINKEYEFDSYDAIRAFIPSMDLKQKTTETNSGRGLYSYKIDILLNDKVLDTISSLSLKNIEVSEVTDKIIVENFRIQDGYADKFVLKWDNYYNRKYTLYIVDADGDKKQEIGSFNNPPNDADTTVEKSFSYIFTEDVNPDSTYYFAIMPSRDIGDVNLQDGQMVYAGIAAKTLGVPQLSLGGESTYSAVTAAWTETQKADTYRVRYRYTEGSDTIEKIAETIKKEDLSVGADGKYKYTFKPEGNEIAVTKAGLQIQIQVDALNKGLQTEIKSSSEISTTSKEDVRTRLVGPALLNPSANQAASPQEITVSWAKISGAGGYYVFRRQFNMTNTAEEGTKAVVYYVPAAETQNIPVTGKDLALDSNPDTTAVKASASFASSRYTLKDTYMTDNEYNNVYKDKLTDAYRNQQNDMAQGCSYRYYVVPVISGTALNSIEFAYNQDPSNKNTSIKSYTIQENGEVKYSGAASLERDGFTFGFGQNVIATKGTYVSGIYNETTNNVNKGVRITWSSPPRLPGSGFKYIVYSRKSGGSEWRTVTTNEDALWYDAIPEDRGIAYEYVVGISGSGGSSDPRYNQRFIDKCYTRLDERQRPEMLGFMLDSVKMDSVSRNEKKVGDKFAEEVKWKSAGIKNRDGEGYTWGIDGYEVYVMNRNIDAEWHKITEIPYDKIPNPNQTDQSVMVTTGMGSVTLDTTAGAMSFDLLRVMRDYKHFFKVRSYVNGPDGKVYCPDPNWTYAYQYGTSEADHIAKSNNMQNDYVKWGARQITSDEFIKIVSVYAGRGICESWKDGAVLPTTTSKTYDAGKSWGGSGSVTQNYVYQGATDSNRTFKYSDFKVDLLTRTGQYMTFLTLNGNIWARSYPINSWPFRYGEDGWVTVKGPWDTPDLYTGQIKFGANKNLSGSNNGGFSWNGNGTTAGGTSTSESDGVSARIAVKYPGTVANPGAAAEVQYLYRGQDTALQFKEKGDTRYQLEDYK